MIRFSTKQTKYLNLGNSLCGAKIENYSKQSSYNYFAYLHSNTDDDDDQLPSTPNDHNFLNKYRCNLSHFTPKNITLNFLHFKIVSVFKFSSHEQWTMSFRLMPCGPWRHLELYCLWNCVEFRLNWFIYLVSNKHKLRALGQLIEPTRDSIAYNNLVKQKLARKISKNFRFSVAWFIILIVNCLLEPEG